MSLDVERVKSAMQKKKRSASTIRTALAVIRQLFNMARRHKIYFGENPVKEVRFPKADNRRTRFLTQAEAGELLAALWRTSPDVHDQALFSLGSGARFSELANLTWQDVDLDRGEALLTGIDRTGKSGKSRTVPLTVEAVEMLKRRKAEAQEGQGLVFPSKIGEPMGQISATFMRTVDGLGWNKGVIDPRQKIVFHSLRHSYCSWLAMAGVPLYTLVQLSGHETMSMVQRYSHLSPGTLRDAVSLLNGNLKTKGMENLRKEKQHSTVPANGTVGEMHGPLASGRGETEL
ncbi:MAG: site-specific integrase [Desulfatiglandaceae bacterium]